MGSCFSFLCRSRHDLDQFQTRRFHPNQPVVYVNEKTRDDDQSFMRDMLSIRGDLVSLDAICRSAEEQILGAQHDLCYWLVFQPSVKQKIVQLRSFLRSLREECRSISWVSREHAGETQALAADFVQVCLPRLEDPDIPSHIKCGELADYEQGTDRTRDSRIAFDKRLSRLTDSVYRLEAHVKAIPLLQNYPSILQTIHQLSSWLGGPNENPALVNSVRDVLRILSPAFSDQIPVPGKKYSSSGHNVIDPGTALSIHCTGVKRNLSAISLFALAIYSDIKHLRTQLLESEATQAQPLVDSADLKMLQQLYSNFIPVLHEYQVAVAVAN